MAPDPPPDPTPDDLLHRLSKRPPAGARYKLEGEVARGGMGSIIKVWDEDLRRHLAMKVVLGKDEVASTGATPLIDSKQLARFLEEAQVTGQLDHPGIVPVHELGFDSDGRVYFTMKLVKGRDLKTIFDLVFAGEEGWNETRALGVILKACEALAYAHSKGVIHRDLKPANVMVGSFGEVYVMDWGLSRVLGRKDTHDIRIKPEFTTSIKSVRTERRTVREDTPDSPIVTMNGDVMGTPAYMSPEQARGEIEKLSPRSDVYAIGAMLYHLLAREMPFVPEGARMSPHTILSRVIDGPPKPLISLAPRTPGELVAICEKAMARQATDRYASTIELAEDLRAYLEHRVVRAYRTGAWAELKKWVARNKGMAATSAAAVVSLLLGLIVSSSLFVKARQESLRADAQAAEAKQNALTAKSNEERAVVGETLAKQENTRANAQAMEAEEQRKLAQQRADDVLSLSAIQDLQDLIQRADALWPVRPEDAEKYETWLRDAHALIDGRPSDPARETKAKPGIADHRKKLAELEARASPQSTEARAAERASAPRAAELDEAQATLGWLSRMLGESPRPNEAEVSSDLEHKDLPPDANGLNNLAWELVDPNKPATGGETKGLVLARRAVERASPTERPAFRDTLAWALCLNGQFDEGLAEESKAVGEVPEEKRAEFEGYLARIDSMVSEWTSPAGRGAHQRERDRLASEVPKLEREVSRRRAWNFADGQDTWWHSQLSKLVDDLDEFADQDTGLCSRGITAGHGWGMQKRLEFARSIEERSVTGAQAAQRWAEAIASIRDRTRCPRYDGLSIAPQLGLVPIGRDASSGLWEFAHLQTGDPTVRGADGTLILKEETGLVFVLIPGGEFWMGAQSTDASGKNYEPVSFPWEFPVQQLKLAPFFLSKYELTQGQWLRLLSDNPSQCGPHNYRRETSSDGKPFDLLHPVEQVSWTDAYTLVENMLGLRLPTEAQWEYAARAGTTSPWWTGDDKKALAGAGNLADSYAKAHWGGNNWTYESELNDGYTMHAPVGRFRPNPFGLHDTIGNVSEWCRDAYGTYDLPVYLGDGERQVPRVGDRVARGSSYGDAALYARSANRMEVSGEMRRADVGVRPARAITP